MGGGHNFYLLDYVSLGRISKCDDEPEPKLCKIITLYFHQMHVDQVVEFQSKRSICNDCHFNGFYLSCCVSNNPDNHFAASYQRVCSTTNSLELTNLFFHFIFFFSFLFLIFEIKVRRATFRHHGCQRARTPPMSYLVPGKYRDDLILTGCHDYKIKI